QRRAGLLVEPAARSARPGRRTSPRVRRRARRLATPTRAAPPVRRRQARRRARLAGDPGSPPSSRRAGPGSHRPPAPRPHHGLARRRPQPPGTTSREVPDLAATGMKPAPLDVPVYDAPPVRVGDRIADVESPYVSLLKWVGHPKHQVVERTAAYP